MKHFFEKKEVKFVIFFFLVFLITFSILYVLGLVPTEIIQSGNGGIFGEIRLRVLNGLDSSVGLASSTNSLNKKTGEEPISIEVPKVGIDITVSNPKTTDNNILDEYLTKGAVHYDGSGLIGAGNMLIFGHSSNWAVVKNKAYKALNGIDKLKPGDEIYVKSGTANYLYRVTSERLANADEVLVDFSKNKDMLTLSTCDLFGAKQQRFVVEADFVGKK